MANPECGGCGQGFSTCDEVWECVKTHICTNEGLLVDEDNKCVGVKLSPLGNLSFDENGGLRDTCCDPDNPAEACRHRVSGLGDFVVAGAGGGANLLLPYGSPQAIDTVKTIGTIDIIANRTFATIDGIATWAVYGPKTALSYYTTSPTSAIPTGMTGAEWSSMWSDCGSDANATGRNADAPSSVIDVADGGWYGFYARPYRLMTALEALERINARKVVYFYVESPDDDPSIALDGIDAAIDAANTACMNDAVMIGVRSYSLSSVATIANAQITPVVNLTAADTTTAQQVSDAGAAWVALPWTVPDERITEFVQARLHVLISTNSRHLQTTRAKRLGARGIIAGDPIYAPGALGGDYLWYRRLTNSYVRRTTSVGHLTRATDNGSILDARGYTKQSESGLFINVTNDVPKTTELIGNAGPIATPQEYSITWRCQVEVDGSSSLPDGSGPRMGPAFSMMTDVDASDDANPSPDRMGYACFIRVGDTDTGTLVIGRYDAGANFVQLAESTTARPIEENTWMTFRLDVTATDITFKRTDGTDYAVTVTDDTYRGGYVHWVPAKAATSGTFQAGLQDFTIIPSQQPNARWRAAEDTYGTWGDATDNAGTWGALEKTGAAPAWSTATAEDGTEGTQGE